MASPLGPLTVLASDNGVPAIAFEGDRTEQAKINLPRTEDHPIINATTEQLAMYFEGTLKVFDLPLDLRGTNFQKRVWKLLLEIPFGETRTYGDIARALGNAGASQAVGAANGKNPVAIVVPCHRVIGASGHLTGYAGGMEKKKFLLTHEGVIQPTLFG
ncbi:MAG: methylated-DNA--[protein]-cysteine S-methyltransferase [Gemmatimonadetes bacterium]|nr:methylated-DNA--[protein]-cysteine S-methyltransferase [Gemmatimonadota bacterium]MYF17963.1 methylated-DNA--[protein]-cysteine S-methyltransferase [Gemmatimonadota bacterium]